ncbi:hypothetical protein ACFL6Y_10650 [Elusimicrobiota bacterium]
MKHLKNRIKLFLGASSLFASLFVMAIVVSDIAIAMSRTKPQT